MEKDLSQDSEQQDSVEELPSLIKYISSNEMAGFDTIALGTAGMFYQHQPTTMASATAGFEEPIDENQPISKQGKHHTVFSISMPTSPIGESSSHTRRVIFKDTTDAIPRSSIMDSSSDAAKVSFTPPRGKKYYSQPITKKRLLEVTVPAANFPRPPNIRNHKLRDHRYDSFKTWDGKLERQITNLRGKPRAESPPSDTGGGQKNGGQRSEKDALPVDRYFDALEGPELETLRPSEQLLLPDDKLWPFLLRYPVSSFGICLGVSSQAIMWKTLATAESTQFLNVSLNVNLVLWCIAIALVIIVGSIYLLKLIFFYEAVRREYYHPIRVNFFFAPWIALLFLALGVPPNMNKYLHPALWYVLMTPILCLELKIYGQWMSGGQRRLSKVANPSNHLSIVGNFVGALLGATMGLKEGPIFFFAVGLAHYTVLFVTLYQRLPTNETLPKELHPVFFLFVAAPSVASMAWAKIEGSFDYGSRIAYFIALFLYVSLAVRVNFFRGFKFSLAWWAYTFPMTGAAIATIRYSNQVTNVVTRSLVVILCMVSTLTVTALLVTTIVHAFVLRDLFPNDIAIAISNRRPKQSRQRRKWFARINGSPQKNEIENYLKFTSSDSKEDLESGLQPSSSSENIKQQALAHD